MQHTPSCDQQTVAAITGILHILYQRVNLTTNPTRGSRLRIYYFLLSSPPNTEFIIDNKILNTNAHQKPSSENPGTNQAVNNTKMVLTTNRKSPNVTIVIGIVNKTRIGFINTFRTAKMPATTIAIKKLSTCAPGKTVAQIKTAIAESKSLIIKLLIARLFVKSKR